MRGPGILSSATRDHPVTWEDRRSYATTLSSLATAVLLAGLAALDLAWRPARGRPEPDHHVRPPAAWLADSVTKQALTATSGSCQLKRRQDRRA